MFVTPFRTAFTAIAVALIPLSGVAALEPPVAIRPSWGVVTENLQDPSIAHGVASPSINFNFGSGVVMPLFPESRITFEPSADFYFYNTEYANGQAVPTSQEFSSDFTLGLLLDAPVVYSLPAGNTLTFGVGAGLCLDLRVAFSVDPARTSGTPAMNSYYWDKARFIMPSLLVRGEYRLTDRVGFGFTGRMLWPIHNLWTTPSYGFFDRAKYLVDLTIRYRLSEDSGTGTVSATATVADPAAGPAAGPAADAVTPSP
jgi:hypothetical protein